MRKESDPRLIAAKEKLQNHLIKNNLSLETLFRFIDKDKSKSLSIEELTRGLTGILSDDEIRYLFIAVDRDNSNSISYEELIQECSKIHCAYVLDKIRTAINSGKQTTVD